MTAFLYCSFQQKEKANGNQGNIQFIANSAVMKALCAENLKKPKELAGLKAT